MFDMGILLRLFWAYMMLEQVVIALKTTLQFLVQGLWYECCLGAFVTYMCAVCLVIWWKKYGVNFDDLF